MGYSLVIGVALCGTVLGFTIADYYQKQAVLEEEDAIEELYQVYRLKSAVFRVRTRQHKLILYTERPALWQAEYAKFLENVAEVKQSWIDFKLTFRNPARRLKDTPQEKVAYERLLQTQNGFNTYLEQSETLFQTNNPNNLPPATLDAAQEQLLNFMHTSRVFTLDGFLNDIAHLVEVTAAEYDHAKADLRRAEKLRFQIIIASLLLSIVSATLLAVYMNRAIARPIQAVTHVAQQVTEESNFDLQAPITTYDEIGILAASLNRLIQEVQQLLKAQEDANEQLEVYSEVLEKKVQERTQELKEKNQSLQKTLEDLRQTQAQLIQTEEISSLRQTIASIAKEIDTPKHRTDYHLTYIGKSIQYLLELVDPYQQNSPEFDQSMQTQIANINIESLQIELLDHLRAVEAEFGRMTELVQSLHCFVNPDGVESIKSDQLDAAYVKN